MSLYSHHDPQLLLQQHLGQVWAAARVLLGEHASLFWVSQEWHSLVRLTIQCHDLGKGSPAFQDYIRNPRAWRGDPREKAHSALSAALAISWAAHTQPPALSLLDLLLLVQAVAGHHAGFRPLERLEAALREDDAGLLQPQWEKLDISSLSSATRLNLSAPLERFDDARRWLFRKQKVRDLLHALPRAEAVAVRLRAQALLSLLLEADKVFLALDQERLRWLRRTPPELSADQVTSWVRALRPTPLNQLRADVRARVVQRLDAETLRFSMTLPTGAGKTLLAATWALTLRARLSVSGEPPRRIVWALPFLSIIDQTTQILRTLLGEDRQGETLMASHSLSQREYELEGDGLQAAHADFYLDTWQSALVVTTFDQLLLALFSPKTRHQMRFHRLTDALIVLDEIQAIPCILWMLLDETFQQLTETMGARVLLMSATQPAIVSGSHELAGTPDEVAEIFQHFRRYQIALHHQEPLPLSTFLQDLPARLETWLAEHARVLITVNTRRCARQIWEVLRHACAERVSVYLLTSDLTPRDRLAHIQAIGRGEPCVVVSTQTVEAGVDIDMTSVIRDMAPLDALVQVAGRCNRNNCLGVHGGRVELIHLVDASGRPYSHMVYDPVLLDATQEILSSSSTALIPEEAVLDLGRRYFSLLRARKNTGDALVNTFAQWGEMESIRTLLRGKDREEVTLTVLTDSPEDTELHTQIEAAMKIQDRWERRSAWRRLAGDLAACSLSVPARWLGVSPTGVAKTLGPLWILRPGNYTSMGGFDPKWSVNER